MFNWFKNQDEEEAKEVKVVFNKNNYETKENGDIKIRVECGFNCWTDRAISKDDIVFHTEKIIVFKDYRDYYNFESRNYYSFESSYMRRIFYNETTCTSIENKKNLIKYKETQLKTYEYFKEDNCWKLTSTNVVGTEIAYEKTPLEVFNDNGSKYKLIETEEEFNEYLSSDLDCDTWCRKKLYGKMKDLGLGDGFINQFADLVGNDLDKYHAMIDLAGEVTDKDTLMYLYTYKFGKK